MTTMINPSRGSLPEDLPGSGTTLFQRTLPACMVRRLYGSDVFVTDLRVTGFNTYQVGVRWPAGHGFYRPTTPECHDPLLFMETMRQAGLLIAHVAFDIPAEYKYMTHEKQLSITTDGLRTNGDQPVDMVLSVTAHDIRRRGRGFAGMLFEYALHRDGVQVGTGAIRWSCVSGAGYDRLRGTYRHAEPVEDTEAIPVSPELVGRDVDVDVFLAEAPESAGWLLRINPVHPFVFDHPIEHVPGNGSLEAARQAALLLLGDPTALAIRAEISFQHYIEFDQPCLVLAEIESECADRVIVAVTLEQGGRTAAQCVFEFLT